MHRLLLLISLCLLPVCAGAESLVCDTDPLAPSDDNGLLHRSPTLNSTDLAPRYPFRFQYYFLAGDVLTTKPAYVGALQEALIRHGYYCGPIDGVFSQEVSGAIARMQKNHSQRVTGTLTFGVRRALNLP